MVKSMELEFIWKEINAFFKKKSLHFLFFTKPKSQPLWPDNQPISGGWDVRTHNIEDCCLSGKIHF